MEEFKLVNEVLTPDIRSLCLGYGSLTAHHQEIQKFKLHEIVPENVRSSFATAQNILLYTWYSFDLYPVADLKVLITLELALRERIGEDELGEIAKRDKEKGRITGMHSYICYAIKNRWIKNEDFSIWHAAPSRQAEHARQIKAVEIMNKQGLDEYDLDDLEFELPETNTFDFMVMLRSWIHKVRNTHAHGSTLLNPTEVWSNFITVTEFINVLWPNPESGAANG